MIYVYGTDGCRYCQYATEFLENRKVPYEYIDVAVDTEAMALFRSHSFKTVPQIFIDNEHIGGYTDLRDYMRKGWG